MLFIKYVKSIILIFPIAILTLLLPSAGISDTNIETLYEKLNSVDTTYQSPHTALAKPYYSGAVNILFIGPGKTLGRDVVELWQRMDLSFEVILTHDRTKLGNSGGSIQVYSLSEEAKVKEGVNKLSARYDAIVMDFDPDSLPLVILKTIKEKVEAGSGLLFLGKEREVHRILQTSRQSDKGYLNGGIPGKFSARALGRCQKGRVAIFPSYSELTGKRLFNHDTELLYSGFIKAVLWVSGKDSGVIIEGFPTYGKQYSYKDLYIAETQININNTTYPRSVILRSRFKNVMDEVIHENEHSFNIVKDRSFMSIPLPTLSGGTYYLEVVIMDENKKVLSWGTSSFRVKVPISIDYHSFDEAVYKTDDIAHGFVYTTDEMSSDFSVDIIHFDGLGRQLEHIGIEFTKWRDKSAFDLDITSPLSPVMRVHSRLWEKETMIAKSDGYFYVFVPEEKDFNVTVFMQGDELGYRFTSKIGALIKQGIDSFVLKDLNQFKTSKKRQKQINSDEWELRSIIQQNSRFIPVLTKSLIKQENIQSFFIDRKAARSILDEAISTVQKAKKYSSPFYLIKWPYETGLYPSERILSKQDLKNFQDDNRKKYNEIEAFNKVSNTSYSNFSDIMPVLFSEAKTSGNFCLWLELQKYMRMRSSEFMRTIRDTILSIDPHSHLAIQLSYGSKVQLPMLSIGKNDYSIISFSPYIPYNELSFIYAASSSGQSINGGLYFDFQDMEQRKIEALPFIPWYALFNDLDGLWFDGINNALSPGYGSLPVLEHVMTGIQEIKTGIGKLLLISDRVQDPIALYHNSASVDAAYFTLSRSNLAAQPPSGEFKPDPVNAVLFSQASFLNILRNAGYQPQLYNSDHSNTEIPSSVKVLILPFVQTLSEKEIERIKDFVKNGGLLIADMRPGIMDENGNLSKDESINEIFGIKRESLSRIAAEVKGIPKIGSQNLNETTWTDPTVRLRGGSSGGTLNSFPIIITNMYGKGTAVLLNFSLIPCLLRDKTVSSAKYQKIINEILSSRAIVPKLSLSVNSEEYSAVRSYFFKDGTAWYVGIILDPGIMQTGINTRLKFPERGHLYNIRNKRYLGFKTEENIPLEPSGAALYGLIPYKINGLDIRLKPFLVSQGSELEYVITLRTNSQSYVRHVIHFEIKGPDSEVIPYYTRNLVMENGELEGKIRLSMNEPTGRYTITVTEVVSDMSARREFGVNAVK